MPYGLNDNMSPRELTIRSPGTIPVDGVVFPVGGCFSRSGTDRNGAQSRPRRVVHHYEQVPVTVYNGPRLAFKVRGRDGRMHWAREPITTYKTIARYTRFFQVDKDLLVPNDLVMSQVVNTVSDPVSIQPTSRWPGYYSYVSPVEGDIALLPFRFAYGDGYINPVSDYYNFARTTYQSYTELPSPIVEMVERCKQRAANKLHEKAKSQKVNLAQAIAERKQTLNMFADLAKRLAKVILAAKSGNLLRAASYLFPKNAKELSNDYLMWKYGVSPLLSDLNGLAQKLAAPMKEVTYDIRSHCEESGQMFTLYEDTCDIELKVGTKVKIIVEKVEVRYKCRVAVSNGGLNEAKEFGFLNLPALGWELIPFSFVADWVLPIGDYVNNLDAFVGLRVLWVTETVAVKYRVLAERTLSQSANQNRTLDCSGSARQSVQQSVSLVTRSMSSVVPELRLKEAKLPSVNNWLTAAALFLQRR